MDKTHLFQRIILFSIEAYLDDIKDGETYNYTFMLRIRTNIRGYITFHRFNKEEQKLVAELADTEPMKKMAEVEIDRTLFAIELLYLYITDLPKSKRANLNMSDTKLKQLKSTLVTDMLRLKQRSAESHARVKEILDDTKIATKRYYYFIKEHIDG